MFLRKGQFIFGQGLCLQTRVDVSLECEYRLFGVIERKIGLPVHKSLVIQRRDILETPIKARISSWDRVGAPSHQRCRLIDKQGLRRLFVVGAVS